MLVCHNVLLSKDIHPNCRFGYERVHMPLWRVADTPCHIQGDKIQDDIFITKDSTSRWLTKPMINNHAMTHP